MHPSERAEARIGRNGTKVLQLKLGKPDVASRKVARRGTIATSIAFSLLAKEQSMSTEGRASNLVSSDKESGKAVYGADNKKIGSIESVMIDKTSGEIAYAVLSFGGFLGIGTDHYPVPWKALRYDADLGGYRSGINENRLKGAPKHGTETIFDWNARYAELDDYYNDEVIRPG
jgi:hypothetical protein